MPGKQMAQFNKRFTNHLIGVVSPFIPPWATVTHVGRKSGKTYKTPVAAFVAGNTVAISLAYGADVDWALNLAAAGSGELTRLGKTKPLTNVRIIERSQRGDAPKGLRRVVGANSHTLIGELA